MSRQEEDFKRRAKYFVDKAARESGPYRDVLLGVAEGFAALATHQAVLDSWSRLYPSPARNQKREEPPPQPRPAPAQAPKPMANPVPRQTPSQGPSQAPREAPGGTAAPVATPKR